MKVINKKKLFLLLFAMLFANFKGFATNVPVTTDSRIKTFVYSENEVFRIIVHHGYQTSIEFGESEEINMISIGNNYAWQLTPVDRRLFIKPLEENIITNMTVLTSLRAYHFEVQSKLITYTVDEELAYVIRFYYPELDPNRLPNASKKSHQMVAQTNVSDEDVLEDFNFNYEISCNNAVAPLQVFDNGKNTFFKFDLPDNATPEISYRELLRYKPLEKKQRGNFVVVDKVARDFKVEYQGMKSYVHRKD